MLFIGIDPSKMMATSGGGAVAVLDENRKVVGIVEFNQTEADVSKQFLQIIGSNDCLAVIEKVNAMPQQGVVSMFNFGQGYGFLRGLLIGLEVPFKEVMPKAWQKHYTLPTRKGNEKQWKNILKAKAQQLYPQAKINLRNADALLIATFALETLK